MSKGAQRPVRTEGGMHDDYKLEHPAFGLIGAGHGQAGPPGLTLFGSDFRHQNFTTIRLYSAVLNRGLHSDRYFGEHVLAEVTLSEAQWAAFVSRPNSGFGVPCTIEWLTGVGPVPGIINDTDRRTQFNEEVAEGLAEAIKRMRVARDLCTTNKQRQAIDLAIQQLQANMPFVAQVFDEHAEKTIESMKTEVHAYIQGAITRAGLKALGAPDMPVLALPEGEEDR